MPRTESFHPPSASLSGKPEIPEWLPPPSTKETHNFAKLTSIDLSLMDSEDQAVVERLVQQVKTAIRDDGFLFLENYGVSLEQVRLGRCNNWHKSGRLSSPSYIVSSRSRNIYTTTSVTKTNIVFFLIPRQENGPDTSIHMVSRCV